MPAKLYGGIDIAIKVPPHQYEAMIAFYRDIIGLKPITEKLPDVGFELGPNKLWVAEAPEMSRAEVWLELLPIASRMRPSICPERVLSAAMLSRSCRRAFKGGWITSPANIIHMVREPDAW